MPTYFGYTAIGGTSNAGTTEWFRNRNYVTGFTCPGSGLQVVKELSIYTKSAGGTPGNVLIAIYDASHNLICQGATEELIDQPTPDWYGHKTTAKLKPYGGNAGDPCYLNGGQQYDLAFGMDSDDTFYYYDLQGAGSETRANVDYTAGFPATLADVDSLSGVRSVRCGVDPVILACSWHPEVSKPSPEKREVIPY